LGPEISLLAPGSPVNIASVSTNGVELLPSSCVSLSVCLSEKCSVAKRWWDLGAVLGGEWDQSRM